MEQVSYEYAPGYIAFATLYGNNEGQHILSFHKGDGTPAHETRTYNSVEELHVAMAKFAPVDQWQEVEENDV
jgi:hypothetical protein